MPQRGNDFTICVTTFLVTQQNEIEEQFHREMIASIEEDAQAGRLDKLAEKSLAAHKAGRTKEL